MASGNEQGLTDAIGYDIRVMHETWMEMLFPRQRGAEGTVLGKWTPEETREIVTYRLWYALGVPVIAVFYPLVLLGYVIRFQARKLNVTAVRLGFVGVVLVFALLWGGLTAAVYLELQTALEAGAVTGIGAASGVAVLAAALAYGFWRLGGRFLTILFAYPFAVTALFLPPVVAALFWEPLGDVIIEQGDDFFSWAFDAGPDSITDPLGERYDRDEEDHAIIWFAISYPVGWLLGILVSLANLIRPTGE